MSKRTRLQESLISTGFPFRAGDNFPSYLAMMGDVMQRTAGLRRPGAAALDLAYVAAGFTEGFFETGLQPWDVAAGSLLVTEAGGLIGNFSGDANFMEQKECLAGNPKIYAQMVSIIGKYSKFASAGEKAEVRTQLRKNQAGAAAAANAAPAADTIPAASPAAAVRTRYRHHRRARRRAVLNAAQQRPTAPLRSQHDEQHKRSPNPAGRRRCSANSMSSCSAVVRPVSLPPRPQPAGGSATLLIESYGFLLGGMGTAAGVTNFCGLHANVFGKIEQVVHGVADDLLAHMRALGGLNEPHLVFGDRIARPGLRQRRVQGRRPTSWYWAAARSCCSMHWPWASPCAMPAPSMPC